MTRSSKHQNFITNTTRHKVVLSSKDSPLSEAGSRQLDQKNESNKGNARWHREGSQRRCDITYLQMIY